MGSWDYSCAVSGLSIPCGTPCRAIIMSSNTVDGFCPNNQDFGASQNLRAVMLPIRCKYDDYGRFEYEDDDYGLFKVSDLLLELSKQFHLGKVEFRERTGGRGRVDVTKPYPNMEFVSIRSILDSYKDDGKPVAIDDIMHYVCGAESDREFTHPVHIRMPMYWRYREEGASNADDALKLMSKYPLRVLHIREDVWQGMLSLRTTFSDHVGLQYFSDVIDTINDIYKNPADFLTNCTKEIYTKGDDDKYQSLGKAFDVESSPNPLYDKYLHSIRHEIAYMSRAVGERETYHRTYMDISEKVASEFRVGGRKLYRLDCDKDSYPARSLIDGTYSALDHVTDHMPRSIMGVNMNKPSNWVFEAIVRHILATGNVGIYDEHLDGVRRYNIAMAEFVHIDATMSSLRKTWTTVCGAGSQDRNYQKLISFNEMISDVVEDSMKDSYYEDGPNMDIVMSTNKSSIRKELKEYVRPKYDDLSDTEKADPKYESYESFYSRVRVSFKEVKEHSIEIECDTAYRYGDGFDLETFYMEAMKLRILPRHVRITDVKVIDMYRLRGKQERYDANIHNGKLVELEQQDDSIVPDVISDLSEMPDGGD